MLFSPSILFFTTSLFVRRPDLPFYSNSQLQPSVVVNECCTLHIEGASAPAGIIQAAVGAHSFHSGLNIHAIRYLSIASIRARSPTGYTSDK